MDRYTEETLGWLRKFVLGLELEVVVPAVD
jgi:hypothetical protein